MKKNKFSEYIKNFDFPNLFNELGWDNFNNSLPVAVNDDAFMLKGIVEKKGFVILHCSALPNGKIPLSNIRKQIEAKVAKHYFEHLIIYSDQIQSQQIWQIAIKEENKPKQVREILWYSHQDTEILFQRLKNLLFTLDEEDQITIVDVKQRVSENFARNTESVTKKFYTEFKKQHTAFLDFIQGIDDHIANKENSNKQWYASLMLNRLMFCYFIQKKGFLNQDVHYLGNKLNESKLYAGKDNFYSFYRSFLLELFHDGLGKPKEHRHNHPIDLGKIPYLNGGLFDVHELEKQFEEIEISDDAFEKLFAFFDQWNWHLDNSIEATGRDINPDVIGYIFEKYINDRAAMGAYYTKEDITDYIGKNTIIPFLFDETERNYKHGFKNDGELWKNLKESGDAYIYDAVKKGVPQNGNLFGDLPQEIQAGFKPELEKEVVKESTSPHLWEIRKVWNTKAPEEIALPTEIYRELIERRKRYAEIKSKIVNGEITHINDFITFNLNIRQFTQDFIENTKDADFIRHFYKAIKKITILDPTCGSGAFLFAALNILEPLYEACITRMEQFAAEQPDKYKFFEETLEEVNSEQHPNLQYFIFKNIILNNLYGVDIMKEAVEIAKLRLFLKLVATVDVNHRKENYGLEPLPDIDFNVRAGNTLIGFATEKELLETIKKKDALFAQAKLDEFKEEFEVVSTAYKRFQNAQLINDQGSEGFKAAKADLNNRLNQLNHKLNIYLAGNYGITDTEGKQKDRYKQWLTTHQPFHWFAEFYQIVASNGDALSQSKGGFDCIIGNPPYVQYSANKSVYLIEQKIYNTFKSGNLYSFVYERSQQVLHDFSRSGMIVQISSLSTPSMETMCQQMLKDNYLLYVSNFATRPAYLFEGVTMNLTIIINQKKSSSIPKIYATNYLRWINETRNQLFHLIPYSKVMHNNLYYDYAIPKVTNEFENPMIGKVLENKNTIGNYLEPTKRKTDNEIFYRTAGGRYFKIFLDRSFGTESKSNKSKHFLDDKNVYVFISVLSSNIWWWWYTLHFDMYNCKDYMMYEFPYKYNGHIELKSLGKNLCNNLIANADRKVQYYETTGNREQLIFSPSKSKTIIDEIDNILARHYGFTEEELDFIINYDIKYRMGKALFGEEDNEEYEDEE